MAELQTIVDENDNVIGRKERTMITYDDIYRVSCLWITNTKGQILLSKRVETKKHDPGKWGPAVAGTVSYQESYDENIKREAEEELGLKDIKMIKTKKIFVTAEWKYFVQFYIAILDYSIEKFVIQKEEVSEVKWFDMEDLMHLVKEHPEMFIKTMPSMIQSFKL